MNMLLLNLPDVILKHLQSFLSSTDIRYFVNTNKLQLSSLKQETIYFSLNKEKSREYLEDERFRKIVLAKVMNGSKQVGLSFHRNFKIPDNIGDVIVHKIVFGRAFSHLLKNVSLQCCFLPNKIKEIPFLPMLQDLTLSHYEESVRVQDVSSLSHLKRLKLCFAYELTDITPLQNVPHLSFKDCPNIRNFSILSNKTQEFLSIDKSSISDVSFLRNMLTVELSSCDELVDVSPLRGIKNLSLCYCSNLQDISCLGNHHRLAIIDCHSIDRGFECFRTVCHAKVLLTEIPDLSVFQAAKSLEIEGFRSNESQLFFLRDIPDLTLRSASINYRKEVYDISHLKNIRLTYYYDILNINDSHFLSQLLYLKMERCDQIVKIINEGKTSIFHHLQSLHITSCSIEHVNGLGDIPTLILENCFYLHDISGLGRNRCVDLRSCPIICDVRSLATIPIVTVRGCDGVVDYTCLSSVPRLMIV